MDRYSARRQAIRDTWLPVVHETETVQAFFISGVSKDQEAQTAIEEEASVKGDVVILGVPVCFLKQFELES